MLVVLITEQYFVMSVVNTPLSGPGKVVRSTFTRCACSAESINHPGRSSRAASRGGISRQHRGERQEKSQGHYSWSNVLNVAYSSTHCLARLSRTWTSIS
jgi:hypothetical protein